MSNLNTLHIFVADDDEDDVLIFREGLIKTKPNAILTVFKNGKEVCDHIQHSIVTPDVIFLDINMPLMNGKECLKKIRLNPMFNEVAIVMYSTSASPREIEETFQSGANLYVPKPSSFAIQQAMLNNILTLVSEKKLWNMGKENFTFKSA